MRHLLIFIMVFNLAACGGRSANPVMINQFGDNNKSCKSLIFEMNGAQNQMQQLMPKTNKTGKNVALGVAGAFVLIPWLFMDFSHAEEQEYNALRQRYNHLAIIAMEKDCDKSEEIELLPSAEDMKAKAREESGGKEKGPYPTSR